MTEPFALVLSKVAMIPVIARLVVVDCVVVERAPVKFCKVVEPVERMLPNIPEVKKPVVARTSVEKMEVEVAEVVVPLFEVKS